MNNFIRLFQIEWLKLKTSRTFMIFMCLYICSMCLLAYISLNRDVDAFIQINDTNFTLSGFGLYSFPDIWQNMTWVAGFFRIIPIILVTYFICNEFSYNTVVQNMIDGLSRKEFIFSKLITIGFISLISVVVVGILAFILGMNYSEKTDGALVLQKIYFLPVYGFQMFAYLSFVMLLSIWFKRTGIVFLALFTWVFIIETCLKHFVFSSVKNPEFYFPRGSMNHLIEGPILSITEVSKFASGGKLYDYVPIDALILTVVYTVIFCMLSYKLLKSRDI